MKEWMCWILLIVGVISLGVFAYWLTTVCSVMTIYYITVILNCIVYGYLKYQKYD